MSLPAYGWIAHSEQTDVASLEQRVWRMRTELVQGFCVITSLLQPPAPELIPRLEALASHFRECQNPACTIGRELGLAQLCPNGKFDPTVCIFLTLAFAPGPQLMMELREVSTTPEVAKKTHEAAVTMLTGIMGTWQPPKDTPA